VLFIGIDNGASGGIAALEADGSLYRCDPMPATDADLLALFEALRVDYLDCFAVLERAQSFPKMGVVGAFTYGRGYGAMQMALHAAQIPFDIVQPLKWQTVLSCRTRGDKNVSKRRAEQLFPGRKITHAIADALLIAEYCRRLRVQDHGKEEKQTERQGGQAASSSIDFALTYASETANRLRALGEATVTPRHGAGTRRKAR
jgi:hypothetical protein